MSGLRREHLVSGLVVAFFCPTVLGVCTAILSVCVCNLQVACQKDIVNSPSVVFEVNTSKYNYTIYCISYIAKLHVDDGM